MVAHGGLRHGLGIQLSADGNRGLFSPRYPSLNAVAATVSGFSALPGRCAIVGQLRVTG